MDNDPTKKRLALLVLRAQSGDRQAMDQLLQSHQTELFGYLMKMLHNHTDAEDALQLTLLRAAKKVRWLREPAFFRAWVFRIASRVAFRIISQRQRKKEFSNPEFIDAASSEAKDESDTMELIGSISLWLDKLTPKGREAVVLHYLEGFTTEEVAEILGIPVGTAKSRISYSLACIRKQITPNEGQN